MPDTPLVHRVLRSSGYALTVLLVLAAVGVLAWPMLNGDGAKGNASVNQPQQPDAADKGQQPNPFSLIDPGQGRDKNAAKPGKGPCGVQSASYKRAKNGIDVTVVYTGVGTVRAVVQPVNGEPMAQSYSTAGDPTPHVFKFENVSAQAIKTVGLTVMDATAMQECEIPRK